MKISILILKTIAIAFVIFIIPSQLHAQKGYPYVSQFTFNESIETDNFDLIQDNHQNILIANRKGLLTFNSRDWDLLPLPYFPVVLAMSPKDGTIYAGCRNGFGLLKQDLTGKYEYQLMSDTFFTGEISAIELNSSREYFLARNRVYYISANTKEIRYWEFSYENWISGSFVFKDELYFMLNRKGLYKAEGDTFKLVLNDQLTTRTELVFETETNTKEILVGNSENELYIFNGTSFTHVPIQDSEYLKASVITDGACLNDNKIAVGSLMGGVLICDYKTGITSAIINYKTGLPDDEIYCLGTDKNHGLWLCHSFGVSRIDNQLNVANLTWYPGLNGNLTNTALFNGQLYIGSSDGLYSLAEKLEYREKLVYAKPAPVLTVLKEDIQPKSSGTAVSSQESKPGFFESLTKKEQRKKRRGTETGVNTETKSESAQQTGILNKIINTVDNAGRIFDRKPEDEKYAQNKKKVYSLQSISHSYEKITGVTGKCTEIIAVKDHLLVSTNNGLYDIRAKRAIPVLPNTYINFISSGPGDKLLFAGSGKTLYILELIDNHWEIVHEFDALDYPVYSACMVSPTELWLGSDNSAHKLTIDSEYFEDNDETFPITTKFPDKVIIRNINNQLHFFLSAGIYKMVNSKIQAFKTFDDLSTLPGYFFSDNNGAWYRSSGHWDFIADKSSGITIPEEYLNIFESVQDIYVGKSGDLYVIANNREVYRINKEAAKIDSVGFSVLFSGIKGKDNQLFQLIKPKISYKKSSLRIELSAPYFIAPGKTEFAYKIKGLNDEWSQWANVSSLTYPLLPPGTYTIQAKARNIFGVESKISSLELVIRPPFWKTTLFYILMIILIFSLFVMVVRFREQNLIRAKLILEQKVRERTAEIARQKDEISEQKKEITDSILYAKRIQTAILPSTSILNSALSEHFVLFLPRDIVSGDFYWSTVKGDKIVFLAADCTGHGVPGAFMSMLGVSFLNEIVSSHNLDDASIILNELRNHVKSTLAKSGGSEQARDGMDIALCIIDQKQKKLQFAGAYNPLYMIRKGELTEIKADKMPIGLYEVSTPFTNNVVDLKKGDCFYVFSDGFIDQFGGELGKKFLSKPFKELLKKIHTNPMAKQKEMLESALENWKGNLQQVDDILIIGFRI